MTRDGPQNTRDISQQNAHILVINGLSSYDDAEPSVRSNPVNQEGASLYPAQTK